MFTTHEATMVARLKAKLGDTVYVGVLDELERVPEMRQRAPAVWVVYDGYIPIARQDNVPAVVALRMSWWVVAVAKSAKGQGGVEQAKSEAGLLAEAVLRALLGFHLGGGKYLQVEEAPGPEYDAGYCHLPLAFSTAATFKGDST